MPPTLSMIIVEDHADTRSILNLFLSRSGYSVRAVGTCAGALQVFEQNQFDVLLSDVWLPDGDGCWLVQRLLACKPDLYAIAVTGLCEKKDVQRCREAGFKHHLCKPFTVSAVESLLLQAVEDKKSRRAASDYLLPL